MKDNPIAPVVDTYKTVTVNPLGSSALLGGTAFGLGAAGWDTATETARSLFRQPAKLMFGMSNREFDDEIDDIKNDKKLRWILPGSFGAGIMGLSLLLSQRANEEHGGLLAWNANPKSLPANFAANRGWIMPGSQNLTKEAALRKLAVSSFEYNGYIPPPNYSQEINIPAMRNQLFSNDPMLQSQDYTRYFGEASLNASQRNYGGAVNVPLGVVQDTVRDKFSSKFSLGGITNVAMNAMLANTAARLFTTAIGTMANLSQDNRQKLIDAGTWAGTISSIIN